MKLIDLKKRVMAAVSAGANPSAFAVPDDRFARATVRIGLRQLLAAANDGGPYGSAVALAVAFHGRRARLVVPWRIGVQVAALLIVALARSLRPIPALVVLDDVRSA